MNLQLLFFSLLIRYSIIDCRTSEEIFNTENRKKVKAPRQIVMSAVFILHAICAWSLRNLPGLPGKIP